MKSKKTILICPLDWGLGHATRCIPIINECLKKDYRIIIAADKEPLALLQQEFPDLKHIVFPGYTIDYPKEGNMAIKMLLQSPKIWRNIKKEHRELQQLIKEHQIDLIISDNRYGLWSNKIPSVFITHQLFIKAPFGEKILKRINKKYISKFTQCWIPDYEKEPNMSGNLSHQYPLDKNHYQFIGLLSRFSEQNVKDAEYDIMVILSGPEPQRTIFEELIVSQLTKSNYKAIVTRGLPYSNEKLSVKNSRLKIFNHLPTSKFLEYITKSKVVIARSGYSTIMDLTILKKPAILIPTPGQTEQEYLSDYHLEKGYFYSQKQHEFDLEKALKEVKGFLPQLNISAPPLPLNSTLLSKTHHIN